GTGINFSNLTSSTLHSIVFGENVAAKFAPTSEARYVDNFLLVWNSLDKFK
ncbi:subtilisin-like protease-like, partial [Trifolium medium]|nr:subtilisin-like protease-like [Trifolium medium]